MRISIEKEDCNFLKWQHQKEAESYGWIWKTQE